MPTCIGWPAAVLIVRRQLVGKKPWGRWRKAWVWGVVGLATVFPTVAVGQPLDLPPRAPDAPTGSAFASSIEALDLKAREARIVDEILAGNVPNALRQLRPVRVETERDTLVFWTMPDVLTIGTDDDRLRIPMTPQSAQRIADALAMSLPTPAMVDAIWAQADHQLVPVPIPPSPEMTTVPAFLQHSRDIDRQRRHVGVPADGFVAGHKKDVVLSRELAARPGHVAIYGWHQLDGQPIQPLYLGHTADWVDYSHGTRLVSRQGTLNGRRVDLWDVLRAPELAGLLSTEGVVDLPWFIPRN